MHYIQLYEKEWVRVSSSLGSFLQAYEAVVNEDTALAEAVLHCLGSLPASETRLQLYLVLYQVRPFPSTDFYHPTMLPLLKDRTTMKLLYLYYISRLFTGFSEPLLEEYIEFHREFRRKQRLKELIVTDNMRGPLMEESVLTKTQELLKKLKREARIDEVEWRDLMR